MIVSCLQGETYHFHYLLTLRYRRYHGVKRPSSCSYLRILRRFLVELSDDLLDGLGEADGVVGPALRVLEIPLRLAHPSPG